MLWAVDLVDPSSGSKRVRVVDAPDPERARSLFVDSGYVVGAAAPAELSVPVPGVHELVSLLRAREHLDRSEPFRRHPSWCIAKGIYMSAWMLGLTWLLVILVLGSAAGIAGWYTSRLAAARSAAAPPQSSK